MRGIDVQVTDDGPALFEVVYQTRSGRSQYALERDDEELTLIRELAFGLVLDREVRPLPAGAILVRVSENEFGRLPDPDEIAGAVAKRILL